MEHLQHRIPYPSPQIIDRKALMLIDVFNRLEVTFSQIHDMNIISDTRAILGRIVVTKIDSFSSFPIAT